MATVSADRVTITRARPGFEGANIRTWIGFKHFEYLLEAAVLDWIRDQGIGARNLFHDFGLGVEIIDSSIQLPAVLELDDEVRTEVRQIGPTRLGVSMSVEREGARTVVLRGKVTLALIEEPAAERRSQPPEPYAALMTPSVADAAAHDVEPVGLAGRSLPDVLAGAPNSLLWSWRAPYFYCHYTDRVQHSGYVRCLEEVVDRYLDSRGLSVARLLRERSWIPVVSRARVQLLGSAGMEETVHCVFTVRDVLREVMFDGRMTCWVERDGTLYPVAQATILHGYAISAGPGAGGLAELDAGVRARLLGAA